MLPCSFHVTSQLLEDKGPCYICLWNFRSQSTPWRGRIGRRFVSRVNVWVCVSSSACPGDLRCGSAGAWTSQLPVHFFILGCFFFLFSYKVVRIKCNNKELSIFPKCKAAESSQSTLIITALLLFLRIHIPEIQWQPLTEDVLRFDLDVDVISNSLPIFVCWPSVGAWQGPFQASIHRFHPNSAAC